MGPSPFVTAFATSIGRRLSGRDRDWTDVGRRRGAAPSVLALLVELLDRLAVARAHEPVEADVHAVRARAAVDHRVALGVRLDDVVAGPGDDRVGARAAQPHGVVAVAGDDPVAPRAALEVIVAVAAQDDVVRATAVDRVVAGAGVEAV